MKPFEIILKPVALLAALILCVPLGYAEPLTYRGNDSGLGQSPNVAPTDPLMLPVTFGSQSAMATPTEGQTVQTNAYGNFFQSPYSSGGVQTMYDTQAGTGAGNPDPFNASEVSPYSRYSPYMEIIGEGSDYTLGIDDVITVIVRDQPDFSGRFVIDPEGNIQYPFLGDIPAVGKTKGELKQDIVNRLQEFVRYPEVAVMISEYRSKKIYVFGFVGRPGQYAMKGNKITVKEAIVAAGLPRADGSLKRVYVIRPSEFTESGTAAAKKVDLKSLIERGNSAEDFYLKPGDTIIVHQRYFDKFVNGFSRLVGPLFQAAAVYELGFGSGGYISGD